MKQQNKKYLTAVKIAGFAAAATMVLVGCNADKSSMTDFFPADENRAINNIMTAQAAAGARADATLQPMHFDGAKLNSLGEAKLDLMLKDDDSTESVVVYMNLDKEDEDLKSRRDAVVSYLEDRGILSDGIKFESGPNPKTDTLPAQHMASMAKTDSGGGEASTSGASAPSSPSQSK